MDVAVEDDVIEDEVIDLSALVTSTPDVPAGRERKLTEWEQQAVDDLNMAITCIYREQYGAAMRRGMDGVQEIAVGTGRNVPTL